MKCSNNLPLNITLVVVDSAVRIELSKAWNKLIKALTTIDSPIALTLQIKVSSV
jgi:hypothetical protein